METTFKIIVYSFLSKKLKVYEKNSEPYRIYQSDYRQNVEVLYNIIKELVLFDNIICHILRPIMIPISKHRLIAGSWNK